MIKRRLLIEIFTLFIILPLNSQTSFTFKKYDIEDGLSNNSARFIFQDRKGFLWIGTLNGLNRFDGNKFKQFYYSPTDSLSICDNRIVDYFEDLSGKIWFRTYNNKLMKYDPVYETFKTIELNLNEQNSFYILDHIQETTPGILWVKTRKKGIFRINYLNNDFVDYLSDNKLSPGTHIEGVYKDDKGQVWIYTSNGIYRYKSDTSHFANFERFLNGMHVTCIIDNNQKIWIGTLKHGLISYNKTTEDFNIPFRNKCDIYEISINNDGYIIALTDSGFLFINKQGKKFHNKTSLVKPPFNFIPKIYTDSYGIFWITTDKKGIIKFNPSENNIKHFLLGGKDRISISEGDKTTLLEDSQKNIWIGMYGGGLALYDRNKDNFIRYTKYSDKNTKLTSDFVLSLTLDNTNNIWVSTMYGGIIKIIPDQHLYSLFKPAPENKIDFSNEIRSILTDSKSRLWIGTRQGKIYCYNNKFKKLLTIPDDISFWNGHDKLSNVYCLYEDTKGNLWVGTKGQGIYVIRNMISQFPKVGNIINFKYDPDKNSLGSDFIYDILEDPYGQIWIATHKNGLNLLSSPLESPHFISYGNDDVINNKYTGIEGRCLMLDSKNNLWIGCSEGLYFLPFNKLKPGVEKEFVHFYHDRKNHNSLSNNIIICLNEGNDGTIYAGTFNGGLNYNIPNNEIESSVWKKIDKSNSLAGNIIYSIISDNKDNLWVATDFGLTKIYPNKQKSENYFSNSSITKGLFSENVSTNFNNNIFIGKTNGLFSFSPNQMEKSYSEHPVVFTDFYLFNSLINPGHHDFLPASINYLQEINLKHNQNFFAISFACLNLSSYDDVTYAYKLENFESNYNYTNESNIAIYKSVPPGNYKFVLKASSNGIDWGYKIKSININIARPYWNTTKAWIFYILSFIITVTLIFFSISNKIKLRKKIFLEKKSNENKSRILMNISNELKTPLSLILSPVEEIITSKSISEKVLSGAQVIKRNSVYLLNLIELILDMGNLQEKNTSLSIKKIDIIKFFKDKYDAFYPLAKDMEVDLFFFHSVKSYFGFIDPKIVEKIYYCLLSNAIKNTRPHKSIITKLDINETLGYLILRITDESNNIKEEDITEIFNYFSKGTNSSYIELSFAYELTKLHQGTIEVISNDTETTFIVQLPIEKHLYPKLLFEEKNSFISNKVIDKDLSSIVRSEKCLQKKHIRNLTNLDQLVLIEKDPELRIYLSNNLSDKYIVHDVNSTSDAFNILKEKEIVLIICNIWMPGSNVFDFVQNIRSNSKVGFIPTILISTRPTDQDVLQSLKAGAEELIEIPFNMNILEYKIDFYIKRYKTIKSHFIRNNIIAVNSKTKSRKEKELLDSMIQYIEDHSNNKDFSIEQMACDFGYSRTNFFKKIKDLYGNSPNNLITNVRMKKAAGLLINSNMSIKEISEEIGYNDSGYFTRLFKNNYGEKPIEFRRKSHLVE